MYKHMKTKIYQNRITKSSSAFPSSMWFKFANTLVLHINNDFIGHFLKRSIFIGYVYRHLASLFVPELTIATVCLIAADWINSISNTQWNDRIWSTCICHMVSKWRCSQNHVVNKNFLQTQEERHGAMVVWYNLFETSFFNSFYCDFSRVCL